MFLMKDPSFFLFFYGENIPVYSIFATLIWYCFVISGNHKIVYNEDVKKELMKMKLNERQKVLLKSLIEENDYKTLQEYADMLQISYKTVSNDVNVLMKTLADIHIEVDKKPHCGIRLNLKHDQINELNKLLQEQSGKDEYLSISDRRTEIYLQYLWNPNAYYSIQYFSDLYFVSASSIMKDLDIVSEKLTRYDITMEKSKKGTCIHGSEINIRKALLDYMERYLYEHVMEVERYQHLSEKFKRFHDMEVDDIEAIIEFLEQNMNHIEAVSKKIINEPYYSNAFLYLVLMILRIKHGNYIQDVKELVYYDDAIDETDFEFTNKLCRNINHQYDIQITEAEAINVYRHLISGGLSKKEIEIVERNTKANDLNSLTLAYTRYLIEHMSILFGIDFSNQVYLHSNLRFHIKPMINRLRYDIKINNMMVEEIQKRYPLEFYLTQLSCILTSRRYEIKEPSKEEVAYIMVYFQSAIERHLHTIQAILVTGQSVGSAQLLKTRLENTFQDVVIKEILPPSKLNQVNMENIDLILTTGNVSMNLPYIAVSLFCDETDIATIRHYLKNLRKHKHMNPKDISICFEECDFKTNQYAITMHTVFGSIVIQKIEDTHMYYDKHQGNIKYGIFYKELKEINPMMQVLFNQVIHQ